MCLAMQTLSDRFKGAILSRPIIERRLCLSIAIPGAMSATLFLGVVARTHFPVDAKSRRFSRHTEMRRSGSHPGPGFPLDARDLPVQAWCSRLF